MPRTKASAINFLETQWSAINQNKLKGIKAEIRFEAYLNTAVIRPLYDYIIPGGWIISSGRNMHINPPTRGRIAILPIPTPFSWTTGLTDIAFAAQVLAESFFRQVGITTYFTKFETNSDRTIEGDFSVPARLNYPTSYDLNFYKVGANGLQPATLAQVTANFTRRTGLIGMRAYPLGRISSRTAPWTNSAMVTELFWKEYSRYYLHRQFLVSSNDLDFFIIGKSGKAYPVEFKSKTVVIDDGAGDWFGIDVGPFSKLSYFVSLSNNMEALYFVEQVDAAGNNIEWWGVKFSTLLQNCYWGSQSGGTGMGGGMSNTVKVPHVIFQTLTTLLPTL